MTSFSNLAASVFLHEAPEPNHIENTVKEHQKFLWLPNCQVCHNLENTGSGLLRITRS
jgi:hypothetical protein